MRRVKTEPNPNKGNHWINWFSTAHSFRLDDYNSNMVKPHQFPRASMSPCGPSRRFLDHSFRVARLVDRHSGVLRPL